MTRRQTRLNRSIAWNIAIAEGRVVRSQGGLSFASFATHTDALDAMHRIQLAGMDANIVDPSLADDAYLSKVVCHFGECGYRNCNGCGVVLS